MAKNKTEKEHGNSPPAKQGDRPLENTSLGSEYAQNALNRLYDRLESERGRSQQDRDLVDEEIGLGVDQETPSRLPLAEELAFLLRKPISRQREEVSGFAVLERFNGASDDLVNLVNERRNRFSPVCTGRFPPT